MNGNRCGHDPRNPKLTPVNPIRKGKGGLPRILSLAAERAKVWYFHPKKCKLLQTHPHRTRRCSLLIVLPQPIFCNIPDLDQGTKQVKVQDFFPVSSIKAFNIRVPKLAYLAG